MATEKRQRAIEKRKKATLKKSKKAAQVFANTIASVNVQMIGDKTSENGRTISTEDLINILAPETEFLTDELYQELLDKGFPEKTLNELRMMGMQYNRARNSLIDPFTDPSILIEYKQDPNTGKFSLSESRLILH
jgi:hypothetical protein